ncbi:MAG: FGGY-family carbohydrate kinase, partial [Pseudomonadota bacterium]
RRRAEAGELAFGTVDSFLLYKLTGGAVHATDATNAARTMIYNIGEGRWDEDLLGIMNIPASLLPQVMDSSAEFGTTDPDLFGAAIPVGGIAGDQHAATVGQACLKPGMIKSTYGTGCFAVLNTGDELVQSKNRLLGTIAYQIGGRTTYAVEGSIFIAGSVIKWLRDELGIIGDAAESAALAASANKRAGLYFVPAFTGLGAPYWDPDARAAILGMTLDTGRGEIVRAALESVAYQTRDLMEAAGRDGAQTPSALRVDGGMVVNDWFCQFLADTLGVPVERPKVIETTALGAAYLAGLSCGLFDSIEAVERAWARDRLFEPSLSDDQRNAQYDGWQQAVARVLSPGS